MEAEAADLPMELPAILPNDLSEEEPVEDPTLWILVEDINLRENRYDVIDETEVIGDLDFSQNKLHYIIDGIERYGVMHLISTDLNFVENELNFMFLEAASPEFPEFWALVNQGEYEDKIRIVMVGCKKPTPVPGEPLKRGFLLGLGEQDQKQPFKVLHILKSEHDLRDELKYLQDHIMRLTMCEEKDNEVEAISLNDAYLLVQYYEDALTLIFAIVRYQDTVCKEDNQFPGVVAYIGNKGLANQCIILRKSFDLQELTQILDVVRKTCNSMRYSQLHRQLKAAAEDTKKGG